MPGPNSQGRLGREERWPGVLQARLGSNWSVIEEGLPGRTTVHDDPIEGAHKNGLAYLRPCLESHLPIDVLIIMLGTNDLKARFAVPAADIGWGVAALCETALACAAGPDGGTPKLVLVSPVPILETGFLGDIFVGGAEKSLRLAGYYRGVAEQYGGVCIDAGAVARVSPLDGIHFEADQHRLIGEAVAKTVLGL
jgi:lysophospholipase L1-like esterase